MFSVAAGGVGPVHREEPVRHDVLHPDGTAEAPPPRGRDPQPIPGACHLQGCRRPGNGEYSLVWSEGCDKMREFVNNPTLHSV